MPTNAKKRLMIQFNFKISKVSELMCLKIKIDDLTAMFIWQRKNFIKMYEKKIKKM